MDFNPKTGMLSLHQKLTVTPEHGYIKSNFSMCSSNIIFKSWGGMFGP